MLVELIEPFKKEKAEFPILARLKNDIDLVTLFVSEECGFSIHLTTNFMDVSTDFTSVFDNRTWEILPKGTKLVITT